jgi:hypothetical protein
MGQLLGKNGASKSGKVNNSQLLNTGATLNLEKISDDKDDVEHTGESNHLEGEHDVPSTFKNDSIEENGTKSFSNSQIRQTLDEPACENSKHETHDSIQGLSSSNEISEENGIAEFPNETSCKSDASVSPTTTVETDSNDSGVFTDETPVSTDTSTNRAGNSLKTVETDSNDSSVFTDKTSVSSATGESDNNFHSETAPNESEKETAKTIQLESLQADSSSNKSRIDKTGSSNLKNAATVESNIGNLSEDKKAEATDNPTTFEDSNQKIHITDGKTDKSKLSNTADELKNKDLGHAEPEKITMSSKKHELTNSDQQSSSQESVESSKHDNRAKALPAYNRELEKSVSVSSSTEDEPVLELSRSDTHGDVFKEVNMELHSIQKSRSRSDMLAHQKLEKSGSRSKFLEDVKHKKKEEEKEKAKKAIIEAEEKHNRETEEQRRKEEDRRMEDEARKRKETETRESSSKSSFDDLPKKMDEIFAPIREAPATAVYINPDFDPNHREIKGMSEDVRLKKSEKAKKTEEEVPKKKKNEMYSMPAKPATFQKPKPKPDPVVADEPLAPEPELVKAPTPEPVAIKVPTLAPEIRIPTPEPVRVPVTIPKSPTPIPLAPEEDNQVTIRDS